MTVFPLFLVLIVDTMGFGLVFPLIGSLLLNTDAGMLDADASQGLREIWYGISIGCYFVAMLFGSPFFGALSDRWGRKKVLLICLKGTALAYIVSYFGVLGDSLILFIIGRTLAGFLAGSQSIAQAAIIDISSPKNKTINLAMITLASSLGWSIGPLIGGIFSSENIVSGFTLSTPFLISGLLTVINFVWLLFAFKETRVVTSDTPLALSKAFTLLIDAFKHKGVRFIALLFFGQQIAFGCYYQLISLVFIEQYHYSSLMLGLFTTFMGLTFSATLLYLIRLCVRFASNKTITGISLPVIGISIIASQYFDSAMAHWLWLIPIVISVGLSYACLLSLFSDMVSDDKQGWVMGISEAVGAVAWTVASVFTSLVGVLSLSTILFTASSIAILMGILQLCCSPQNIKN